MEEILLTGRAILDFKVEIVCWSVLLIYSLLDLKFKWYEKPPQWLPPRWQSVGIETSPGFKKVILILVSILMVLLMAYSYWDHLYKTFLIIQIPPDRGSVKVIYLIPRREKIIPVQEIESIEVTQAWGSFAYETSPASARIMIKTRSGEAHYSRAFYPPTVLKEHAEKIKKLLGIENVER